MLSFANELLKEDGITYSSTADEAIIEVIRKESIAEWIFFKTTISILFNSK